MSSWLCSRVWRAYSTGVRVSNVARLYGCDPGLGGTAGSLPALSECCRVMNYLSSSSRSDVNTWLCGSIAALVFLEGRHNQTCEYIIWRVHCQIASQGRNTLVFCFVFLSFTAVAFINVITFHPSCKKNLCDYYHIRYLKYVLNVSSYGCDTDLTLSLKFLISKEHN